MPWIQYVAVFSGGTLGALLRERLGLVWQAGPVITGSFAANLIACLAIGLLYGARSRRIDAWLPFAAVGFCGGLSTFSDFAAQVHALLVGAGALPAFGAALLEIVAGLGAVALGASVAAQRSAGR